VSLWIALAVALGMLVWTAKSRIAYLGLTPIAPPAPDAPPADCMVVIPARNEEDVIERAVSSLPHDTVIVVDDGSTDATTDRARKAGAGVLPAPDLPRNTYGKSNACIAGARPLRCKWVLFADADTWFEPKFLEAAVALGEAANLTFVSIYLRPDAATTLGKLMVPYAFSLFFSGTSPRGDPEAAFNGQCVLARRETYEFLGGHAAVYTSQIEDMKLAALADRHRLTYALARTDLGHVELRPWKDFVRNARRFMIVNPRIGLQILAAALTWSAWLPALVWLLIDREWIWAAAFFLLPSLLLRIWYPSWKLALGAPLGIYAMLPLLWSGLTAAFSGRPLDWKGREI
jgi:glycosyltransferase involved in cell wall biosynthesis